MSVNVVLLYYVYVIPCMHGCVTVWDCVCTVCACDCIDYVHDCVTNYVSIIHVYVYVYVSLCVCVCVCLTLSSFLLQDLHVPRPQ